MLSPTLVALRAALRADAQGQPQIDGRIVDEGDGCGGMIEPLPADFADVESKLRSKIVQAAGTAKAAGDESGIVDIALGAARAPKADWKEELARYMTPSHDTAYTWRQPNRRHHAAGRYLPSTYRPDPPALRVLIDASGSVSAELLNEFYAVLKDVVKNTSPSRVEVGFFDVDVKQFEIFYPGDEIKIERLRKMGGGTSYRNIFATMERWSEDDEDVFIVLVLTDGQCRSFPIEAPNAPVVWALTKNSNATARFADRVPFGDVVEMRA